MLDSLTHAPSPSSCPTNRLYVPEPLRPRVLDWCHSSQLACHPGIHRTLFLVQQRFWWPTLHRDVKEFMSACSVCAQAKSSKQPPSGFLRPLPIPRRPWSHIAIDFVTGLPSSGGKTVVLKVVDCFSKMVHFIPLGKLPSAKRTAEVMIQHIFWLHGLPRDIALDRSSRPVSGLSSASCWASR